MTLMTQQKYKTATSPTEQWAERAVIHLSALRARLGPVLRRAAAATGRLLRQYGPIVLGWLAANGKAGLLGLARAIRGAASGVSRSGIQRPNRATRKVWIKQLERMGRPAVRDYLNSHAVGYSEGARIPIADAGITFGTNRHPTRAFVLGWLGSESKDDAEIWRHRLNLLFALVGLVAAVIGVAFLLA